MFIQTEQTPNPATVKFLPGRSVMADGTASFPNKETAQASPLAASLFDIPGVTAVFYGYDFISVTKDDDADWADLKPSILGMIMQHFTSGVALFPGGEADAGEGDAGFDDDPADQPIIDQVKALLDEKVRPAVARDGGDIVYQGFKEGVVFLRMQGACDGCPSSTMTLKHGIENLLRYYVPDVQEVRAI